ncbi:bifunctional phosphopantothenoylcysteine decarboxylase/phosphopantothenate--cysteine ligase CoaBC [sulfur-oxidizing endosymbiont of Gigantopelta aegis]|uniref:bifunctional phosphopantothenoylcysteine decarboxylase/phosphopantothenate--cysteine ligase CoaBC n=1 Tax=sulfur-oxidizing endosymbiont of Gigantopelta aegis TaxID=2794934 RepID=UPI0018DD11C2|nr:bifunctional phosphopantothenoylcysteine decarboxylase/phosphopantothenate--cysteine ligase CoaBC [sulfur-oxidizing endosymbiont of Gigantopelta aegis]
MSVFNPLINQSLHQKKIIVAVCGGIAAYKSALLVRLLVKQGAQVQVVMTHAAETFVTPLTFQALSGNSVRGDVFDMQAEAGMGHIELARWADLIVVAPATANTLAKITHGLADNLLSTLCLATTAPLLIAPAMNQQMWRNEATVANIKLLSQRSNIYFSGPAEGEQACGDVGPGRMVEPEQILERCTAVLGINKQRLIGKTLLITAGPTIEDIDPVRYMSNRSSGKMGYAIAQAAINECAKVILISGPTALDAPIDCDFRAVRSAQQMHDEVFAQLRSSDSNAGDSGTDDNTQVDIFIATAAVADYRPVQMANEKIKKHADRLVLEFVKNPDILSAVAALPNKPICVGFAAETNNVENYALEKLQRKNLDMIAANQVGENQGFEADNNALHLFWRNQPNDDVATKKLPFASKTQLAQQLIDKIVLLFS